jgi:PAS domain S-box-containing protein
LLEVNEAFCRMSGYSEQELLTMNIADIDVVETSSDVAAHTKRILEQGEHRFESLHRRKDGSTYPVEVSVQHKSVEGGQMVAFLRDITERKRVEADLRKFEHTLQEQKTTLEQKNAALRELLEQMGAEKSRIRDNIAANMEDVVMPLLAKLQLKGASRKYVKLLEHHLRDLTAPYARQMVTGITRHLTPRETEICNMIKSGLSSKDIAEMLGVSCQTVQRHRRNIRRRIGLTGKKQNLTSFLANS